MTGAFKQYTAITYDNGKLIQSLANRLDSDLVQTPVYQMGNGFDQHWQEQTLNLSSTAGTGYLHQIDIRPGLAITVMDFSLKHPTLIHGGNLPTSIELGFWQRGNGVRYRYPFATGETQHDRVFLSRIPTVYESETTYPEDERIVGVSLSIDHALFLHWLHGYSFPDHLHETLMDASQFMMDSRHIPSALHLHLRDIRCTNLHGSLLRLYLEAKSMEIVACYANHLTETARLNHGALSSDDIERLYQAKQILLDHMDDPPTLLELARRVCLNDHKLKVGFKAVFGTTVFGLLYDHRMAIACDLIKNHHYSMTEIAHKVGYASHSAFSAAFKRKYGITPSEARP